MNGDIQTWLLNQAPAIVILLLGYVGLWRKLDEADKRREVLIADNAQLRQENQDTKDAVNRHNTELQVLRGELAKCLEQTKARPRTGP